MVRPTVVRTLEDVLAWLHDHDGRIDQLWKDQDELNARILRLIEGLGEEQSEEADKVAEVIDKLHKRVGKVESRGARVQGVVGGVGFVFGTVAAWLAIYMKVIG